jgi:hypothetical protein
MTAVADFEMLFDQGQQLAGIFAARHDFGIHIEVVESFTAIDFIFSSFFEGFEKIFYVCDRIHVPILSVFKTERSASFLPTTEGFENLIRGEPFFGQALLEPQPGVVH